jgi:hypothetical protein
MEGVHGGDMEADTDTLGRCLGRLETVQSQVYVCSKRSGEERRSKQATVCLHCLASAAHSAKLRQTVLVPSFKSRKLTTKGLRTSSISVFFLSLVSQRPVSLLSSLDPTTKHPTTKHIVPYHSTDSLQLRGLYLYVHCSLVQT